MGFDFCLFNLYVLQPFIFLKNWFLCKIYSNKAIVCELHCKTLQAASFAAFGRSDDHKLARLRGALCALDTPKYEQQKFP